MLFTIRDAIKILAPNAANGSPLFLQNTHVTIITGVSKALLPHVDFNLNGDIVISDKIENVLKTLGQKKLGEVNDFTKTDLKIVWSTKELTGDEKEIFDCNLVLRISDCGETGINYQALRNRYGSSLVLLTHLL